MSAGAGVDDATDPQERGVHARPFIIFVTFFLGSPVPPARRQFTGCGAGNWYAPLSTGWRGRYIRTV